MTRAPLSNRDLYLLVLGASLALAMLPVLWPGLDLAVAAYFAQDTLPLHPARWAWIEWINQLVPDLFRGLTMLSLAGWIVLSLLRRQRRLALALAFVGWSLTLGPGLTTWAVKEHTLRARPMDVAEFGGQRQFTPAWVQAQQCTDNCAFTSGHVACGFFFVSLMLLDPRRRWRWIVTGLLAGAVVALARISTGAHWLSDALWALPITLGSSGLVWSALNFFDRHGPSVRRP